MKSWLVNRNSIQQKFHNMAWHQKKHLDYNVQPPLPCLFVVILFSQPNPLVTLNPGNVHAFCYGYITCINLSAILLPSLHLFTDFTSKVNKNQNKNNKKKHAPPKKNHQISAVFCCFLFNFAQLPKKPTPLTPPKAAFGAR